MFQILHYSSMHVYRLRAPEAPRVPSESLPLEGTTVLTADTRGELRVLSRGRAWSRAWVPFVCSFLHAPCL